MSTIKTETLSTPSNATVPVDTVVNGTAKAWVNFNGDGVVAIRRAFNVSSITDGGTGVFTPNFTTAMSDSNYAVSGTSGQGTTSSVVNLSVDTGASSANEAVLKTTTEVQFRCRSSGGNGADPIEANIIIFS